MPEGDLEIPTLLDVLTPLDAVVNVGLRSGCPPQPPQIPAVTPRSCRGGTAAAWLRDRGGRQTVCDECPRRKEKKIREFKRPGTAQLNPNDACWIRASFASGRPRARAVTRSA